MDKVLFVDDQINILNALKRTVEDVEIEVFTATTVETALELLEHHTFKVIFSDVKMPDADGIQFLAKAGRIQPESIRIVLSAFDNKDQILNAVNQGHIWSYQLKPWDNEDLVLILKRGIDFFNKKKENSRLTKELKQSNKKLKQLNNKLEEIVAERTRELSMREEALHMLLNSKCIDKVRVKIEQDLCDLGGAQEAKILLEKPNFDHGDTRELLRHGKCLGYIWMLSQDKNSFKKIRGFMPILEIYLSMARAMRDEDQILDNIDNLLKSLE